MDDPPTTPSSSGLPVIQPPRLYLCPGEDHPIPRSIHLARLAAYYPKCRDCEHRKDTGQLPRSTVGRLEQTAARVLQPSPFVAEGVRGAYLNHLTRQIAGRVAAAVADRLWESQPLVGRALESDEDDDPPAIVHHSGPTIVVGHDARPSSPDLCIGVNTSLRRMGCEVVDIGRVTAPCHAFAVEHLQADAGLFITGSGCPPQWAGLDLLGPRGLPWSLPDRNPDCESSEDVAGGIAAARVSTRESERRSRVSTGTLTDIERRFLAGVDRATRQGGSQRFFDALVPYRASLRKHFRDLRPLRVVCATADRVLQTTLQSVFDALPCDLILLEHPATAIDPRNVNERFHRQVRQVVRDASAACGVGIAEDGRGICLFDERGRTVDSTVVLLGVARRLKAGRTLRILVQKTRPVAEDLGVNTLAQERFAGTREALASELFAPDAGFGVECGGRLWIKDAVPTSDAVLTVGLLLRVLSDLRQPLSTCFSGS